MGQRWAHPRTRANHGCMRPIYLSTPVELTERHLDRHVVLLRDIFGPRASPGGDDKQQAPPQPASAVISAFRAAISACRRLASATGEPSAAAPTGVGAGC